MELLKERCMKRTIIALLAVGLVISSGMNVGVAAAQSSSSSRSNTASIIWDGLWAGSNMDVSSAFSSKSSIASNKQTASTKASTPAKSQVYAALGDSVAAGVGLPSVSNATSQDTQCGRSAQAYPYQVASAINLSLVHKACSGAKAGDLFTKQAVSGPNIAPQLDAAFAGGTPKLITITAGANDAHWIDFIRACYALDCNTRPKTILADAYLSALKLKLYYLFADIQARSNGTPPTVVVTGYYNPLSSQCTRLQQNITAGEITWLEAEVRALNQTLQQVSARFSFVKFAPVSFAGHDICSAAPWVQSLSDPAPFHPTAVGQRVIGQSVLRTLGH